MNFEAGNLYQSDISYTEYSDTFDYDAAKENISLFTERLAATDYVSGFKIFEACKIGGTYAEINDYTHGSSISTKE